jgi:GNAT superfamily N-acetyltransferase
MEIRKADHGDLARLLELYTQLHGNAMPQFDDKLETLWNEILEDKNHHVVIGIFAGAIVSSCVLVIVPNLTHDQRPYALVENVITHEAYRNRGYATRVLHYAKEMAAKRRCYKIMLMTGSKLESTWRFYEKAGYNRTDKTAFVQWLD